MKILFYIHHLGNGGAERVTAVIANELNRIGNQVSICMHHNSANSYTIDSGIDLKYLPEVCRAKRYLTIRRFIKVLKPDVIIAVMPYNFVTMLIATLGLKIPLIASDHTNFQWNAVWKLKFIRYYLYRFADVVTILSHNDQKFMETRLHNMKVMYNPLSFPRLKKSVIRKKNILCVGRISVWDVKGFDLAIQMWGRIAKKYPDWTLEIAGEGEKKDLDYLEALTRENNVYEQTHFLGFCQNIKEIMSHSSIFVLSSRVEGFPCSLLEAMSQGCAAVAFEIHGIIEEIISNGKDGYIIKDGDLDSFSSIVEKLIADEELRIAIGNEAIKSVKRFEVENIGQEWIHLLESLKK